MPVSSLAFSSTVKMETICSSEMSVDFERSTRCYIPEDGGFHNLNFYNLQTYRANRLIEGSQNDAVPHLTFQHATAPLAYACAGLSGQSCGSIRKICFAWVSILLELVPSCNGSFLQFEGPLIEFRNYSLHELVRQSNYCSAHSRRWWTDLKMNRWRKAKNSSWSSVC
jgi:hypothetical protein